jgi:hypothetical protein
MTFNTVSNLQILVASLLTAILTTALIGINSWYMEHITLPVVHVDAQGECLIVENFANGHAFNCQDVDLILRQYRRINQ